MSAENRSSGAAALKRTKGSAAVRGGKPVEDMRQAAARESSGAKMFCAWRKIAEFPASARHINKDAIQARAQTSAVPAQ